jgi:hypothetical protein
VARIADEGDAMIDHLDFARMVNVILFVVTVYKMTVVTWRLAPQMKWYELLGRQGITVTFAAFTGSSILAITQSSPYTFFTFLITTGLTGCAIGFTAWARALPRHNSRRPKKETL